AGSAPSCSLLVDQGSGALDLDDLDFGADVELLIGHVGARAPLLAADLDSPAAAVDALEDDGLRALERGGAGPDRARHLQVRTGDRPQQADGRGRADAEDDDLDPDGCAQSRDHGRGQRGERDRAEEEEPGREDLADREENGGDGPDDPCGHYREDYASRSEGGVS